jgi:hypothetical protein
MNAYARFNPPLGRHAGVAFDVAALHLDCAAHCVDHAAEFDDRAVASALNNAAMMGGNGRINEVAAEAPQSRKRPILVRPGESAVTDHIRNQDRCNLPRFRHGGPSGTEEDSTNPAQTAVHLSSD